METENQVEGQGGKRWLGQGARRIVWRGVASLAGLVLLFGVVGYLWLPGYAKSQLEAALGEALKRPVSIARIEISPYTLSAKVEGIKAGEVLSVDSLYVDVSSASLFRLMPVVSELRIDQLKLHLERLAQNRLNISDLLDEWAKPSDGPTPQFAVSNITLNDGQIEWVDQVVKQSQTVSQIKLGVPFIANVASQEAVFVEPAFSAHLNGSDFNLSGKVRPFAAGQDAALAVELDDFDLTRISAYLKSPLKLESALLSAKLQVTFQRRNGAADTLKLAGDLALKRFKGQLPAQKLSVELPLLSLSGVDADVFAQKFSVRRIDLGSVADAAPTISRAGVRFARWQELSLDKLVLEVKARQAQVVALHLAAPELELARTPAGKLDLLEAFAAPASAQPAARQAAPSWNWAVDKLALDAGRINFTDNTNGESHALALGSIAVEAGKLSSDAARPIPFSLKATVNEHGKLAAEGESTLDGRADVKVNAEHVDLVALQGWVTDDLNAMLTRGDASFKGEVHAANGQLKLAGDVALSDFNVLDRVNAEDMLRLKLLRLDRLVLNTQPFALDVGEIAVRDFFTQLLVNPKGQLNIKGIVRDSQAAPVQPASAVAAAGPSRAPAIHIGKITLSGGAVDFSDEFIQPNYSARLTGLTGRIGALAAGTQSSVEISGKVDRAAPVHIAGWIDPLASPLSLNLQASAHGVDLPNLSSYSGRYLGYTIEKGKLSMDVSYLINKGELTAQNKLFLDQLTLGDKVESRDALDIPLSLALALLKNSRGEIDLDLPIHGSLNDPQFSIGSIVFKVLVNVVVKAVTAPFALLGSLFGGGEDISHVAFVAGSDKLTPELESRLHALAKAMSDRPGLKMAITGYADSSADLTVLKHDFLLRKLKARKLADSARRGKSTTSLDEIEVTAAEYPALLEKVYRDEDFPGKPKNALGMQKGLTQPEMEALMLAHTEVSDGDLLDLAEARGRVVQDWFTSTGGIGMERVFLLAGHVAAAVKDAPGSRVVFSLR
ncbi:MAG: DUF748 domain-containing protein [Nitrosomonadales bacterium]|nr:DUF748 domain-containing protein [Nitrosomonadales bacterium]